MRQLKASSPKVQHGVGLIEVLVAVLILAIGLLGVASMQAMTLKGTQSSYERTAALMAAYSLLDTMRSHRGNESKLQEYEMDETCAPLSGTQTGIAKEKQAWLANLQRNLGHGTSTCGKVVVHATNPPEATVTIKWDDSRVKEGSSTQTLEMRVKL